MEAGDTISNLKMHKLLYYAQGHYLAIFDEVLFDDDIEAWKYGPVVKNVYDRFKVYGNLAIDFKELDNFKHELYTERHLDILPFVFNKYNIQAKELVNMTHSEKPWRTYYDKHTTNLIPVDVIRDFFKEEFKKEAKLYLR